MSTVTSTSGNLELPDKPLTCPACGTLMLPIYYYAIRGHSGVDVLTQCRNSSCGESFVSVFLNVGYTYSWSHYKHLPLKKEYFSSIIQAISPSFVTIFNQASAAEQMHLDNICGVGYRKALEFLVKDFAIKEDSSEAEKIKRLPLQQCIAKYIKNAQVKPIIERAVWLGNDETHYIRKWETKDLSDLKGLISLSVFWIEAEIESRRVLAEMSDKQE